MARSDHADTGPRNVRSATLLLVLVGLGLGVLAGNAWAENDVYVVRVGDTLSQIASRHGTSTGELARQNGISTRSILRVGQKLQLPVSAGAPARHTVRRGETLDGIARAHGVTIQAIVDLNGLARPDRLSIGEEIQIPVAATKIWSKADSPLKDLWAQLDRVPVQSGRWTHIVVHHSAYPEGNTASIDRYHRENRKMENGMAYHFVIGNGRRMGDGQVDVGSRWTRQLDGGHLASPTMNRVALGICLIGNFNEHRPTERQMESLRELSRYLMQRCNIPTERVRSHREINARPTACPGRHFSDEALRVSLRP